MRKVTRVPHKGDWFYDAGELWWAHSEHVASAEGSPAAQALNGDRAMPDYDCVVLEEDD